MKQQKKMEPKAPQQKQYLRSEYNFLDSSKMFLNVLLYPLIVSFIFLFIVEFVAIFSGNTMADASQTWIYVFFTLILTQATFLVVFILYNKKNRINVWKATKISQKVNPWAVVIVVAMSAASIFLLSPFINLINYLLSLVGYNPDGSLPFEVNNFWKFLYAAITMALIPGIVEELLMRGVVFQGLLKRWKPIVAIVIGATLFMLMHTSLQQTVYQFILGILLCYTMYVSGNIIYPIIFHFVNNFTVILVSYIATSRAVSSIAVPYSSAMDYISPFLYLVLGAAVLVGLSILLKRVMDNSKKEGAKEDNVSAEVRPEMLTMINEGVDRNTVNLLVQQKQQKEKSSRMFFWISISLGCVFWLVNTISEFFI